MRSPWLNHRLQVQSGVLEGEVRALMDTFSRAEAHGERADNRIRRVPEWLIGAVSKPLCACVTVSNPTSP